MADFAPVEPAAERATTEREKIALSAEDWNVLHDALDNSPQPNEKLKAAARRYREHFGG